MSMIFSDLIAFMLRRRQFRSIDTASEADVEARKIEPELLLLPRYLSPEKAFVDVGANVGTYTYVANKHLPRSRIFAFEPQGAYVRRLRMMFPGVRVEQIALSSKSGEATFSVPLIGGIPYLSRGTLEHIREPGQSGTQEEVVQLDAFDSIKEKLGIGTVGCMKIDVEGHEMGVLEGAEGTIREDHPTIIIEIEQRHHDMPIARIFEWFFARGYTGEFYDNSTHALRPIQEFDAGTLQRIDAFKSPHYINNFIFTYHA